MIYLVRVKDVEGRARYLKDDGSFTEYWNDAKEFLRLDARKKSKEYNNASVVEKYACSTLKHKV